jgi:3-vinyl bacteriochlorophyllide hydratase
LVSLFLVLRFLWTGEGESAANISVVIKTLTLYTIMITGCIWEKVVFNCYLFAPAFFWEDVFSMLVLLLHTLYLVALATGYLDQYQLMILALAAYATYVINAGQFIWKLRMARLDQEKRQRESRVGVAATHLS